MLLYASVFRNCIIYSTLIIHSLSFLKVIIIIISVEYSGICEPCLIYRMLISYDELRAAPMIFYRPIWIL